MREFFRGGRELPFEQSDKVPQLQSNKDLSSRPKEINKCILACVRFLRYGRNDGRKIGNIVLRIFCVLFSWSLVSPALGQEAKGLTQTVLRGVVSSIQDGKRIEGASVILDKKHTRTDRQGRFTISVDKPTGVLLVKHIGYKVQRVAYENTSTILNIALQTGEKLIEEVEVVSTGYQKIPKERATGSFEFIDSALFNRKVSTDFVSRLEDVVPGISTDKTYGPNRGRYVGIKIRGESTMFSDINPLIVIDGVPYQWSFDKYTGTFNNINPNDIESVTLLKDAAASSIWGAQSGNGVIIITTKRAKYNQPFQLSVNSNVTVGQKPNLYYYPQMNTSDYIDAERFLFDKGYWTSRMNNYSTNLTPVIQLLKRHKEGDIGKDELENSLDALRNIDMREDFLKYSYRESVNQQYSVQLRGGSDKINTSFSIGYDKNLENLVTSSYNRVTIKNNTQLRPVKNLTLDLGGTYTESRRKNAANNRVGYNVMGRGEGNFPYMQLTVEHGNALVVDAIGFNPVFRDTVAGGRLLDWKYRPLDELYASHVMTNINETFLNLKANYQILPSLSTSLLYAFQQATQPTESWNGIGSVYQRQVVNYYATWDKDKVTWNIPVGDFMNTQHRNNTTHQFRYQLDFNQRWNDRHDLNAIAGAEVRQVNSDMMNSVFWGYDPELLTHTPVEYGKFIRIFNGKGGGGYLNDVSEMTAYTNRYVSYFANASYTYAGRYIMSGSIRKDVSNLFGVSANDRGQPFWSVGGAYVLSKESFIDETLFPLLKLRATYGYNGNVNNSTAAYPVIYIQSSPDYDTKQPYAQMQSPPNPSLRWERVGMFNLGFDFSFKDRVSGSIEYYVKRPKDLIASTKIDPTTGYSAMNVNSAHLDGRGVDLSLHTLNVRTASFSWNTNLVFAYNRTKVIKSYLSNLRAVDYASFPNGINITPIEGKDLYSLLTYRWAGLDPTDGAPRGFLDGEVSKDYSALVNQSTIDDLEYHGSTTPLYFASLRNNFSYKNLEFSFNISYQLGHKFLRSTFTNRWFIDSGIGHSDYALRWQKPGDEAWTDVPAFTFPNNLNASELYYRSSALVESAGQIKLRDIQLSYSLPSLVKAGIKQARVYAYVQHVGTLWRANKHGVDPEYGNSIPDPLSVSLGLSFNL